MARKRRRRRQDADPIAPEAPLIAPEVPSEDIPEPSGATDRSCLVHSGHNLDSTCDDCGDGLCSMCEVLYHTESLCASCVELRLKRRGRQSNGWRGWAAMGLGLAAVGALMAPYTLITDPAAAAKLPGGMLFFGYATVATGALGLGLGAAAQDFVGIGRRAGAAGAAMALLALVGALGLSLMKTLSG